MQPKNRTVALLLVAAFCGLGLIALRFSASASNEAAASVDEVHTTPSASMANPETDSTGAPQDRNKASLTRPGPLRPDFATEQVPQQLNTPIKLQLQDKLADALGGQGDLAVELATDLERCQQYFAQLQRADSAALAAQVMHASEADVSSKEDSVLSLIANSPLRNACDGVVDDDFAKIDALLLVAVDQGELRAIPAFLGRGHSHEQLQVYLRDPAAKEAFRARAMRALDAGIRRCDRGSISMMGQFHSMGLFIPQDMSRSFAYELVANWVNGVDPQSSPVLTEQMEALSTTDLFNGIHHARQIYQSYCQ